MRPSASPFLRLVLLLCFTACGFPSHTTTHESKPDTTWRPSQPITWRDRSPDGKEFVAISLSGGGTTASIFGGEAMFYLQALGLLQRTSVLSSVSGGGFPAALYALSCDPDDAGCQQQRVRGLQRPVWHHDVIMPTLSQGFGSLVNEQIWRIVLPLMSISISADRFAEFIDATYLKTKPPERFQFRDLNPQRPRLIMNATVTSSSRAALEAPHRQECSRSRSSQGYLRRRNPDEFFHFAFTDFYFRLIGTDLASYPLALGMAGSAAHPALIDHLELIDYCAPHPTALHLMDGATNDNQAVIELYLILAELVAHQARSDLSADNSPRLQYLGPDDRAYVLIINSSITETTGENAARPPNARGLVSFVAELYDKIIDAIDTYSAVGYNLRKEYYLSQRDSIRLDAERRKIKMASVLPTEIGISMLDRYAVGGYPAYLRALSGIDTTNPLGEDSDPQKRRLASMRMSQANAYQSLVSHAVRARLALPRWHPQCYYDVRRGLDGVDSLEPGPQACVRQAARWATALRAQELCQSGQSPVGLCADGLVRFTDSRAAVLGEHVKDDDTVCGGFLAKQGALQQPPFTESPDTLCHDLDGG